MYQAPLPSSTTGRTCPACRQPAMSLIERVVWRPFESHACQACGATLIRPRGTYFLFWLPLSLMVMLIVATVIQPSIYTAFFDRLALFGPIIIGVQLLNAWLEYRYSPIKIK